MSTSGNTTFGVSNFSSLTSQTIALILELDVHRDRTTYNCPWLKIGCFKNNPTCLTDCFCDLLIVIAKANLTGNCFRLSVNGSSLALEFNVRREIKAIVPESCYSIQHKRYTLIRGMLTFEFPRYNAHLSWNDQNDPIYFFFFSIFFFIFFVLIVLYCSHTKHQHGHRT